MRFAGNRIFLALASVVIAANARGAVELGIALLNNKRVGLITDQTGIDSRALRTRLLRRKNLVALYTNRQLRTNLIARSKPWKREMFFKCCGRSSIASQFARGIGPSAIVAGWTPDVARFKGERSQYLLF